jgi:ABC-type bacteriocin/lantibiotic exporter with double-glycine peptidase domain
MAANYKANVLNLLIKAVRLERKDLFVVIIYAIVIGLLYLIVPLAVQELVNLIAFGVQQTLFILSALVVATLFCVGLLQVLQRYIIEIIQQRLFVNNAFELLLSIIGAQKGVLDNKKINLFFEVLALQKSTSKLLADGLSALLQTVAGFLLLAFYHPWFLALNLSLILFSFLAIFLGGRGGLKTSLEESNHKYDLVNWLQDLGSCQESFQLMGNLDYMFQKTDKINVGYLNARLSHFGVLTRQRIASFLVQIVANGSLLALGGYLVIQGQLTLGQLIAAELVVNAILVGLDKFVSQLDVVFDLLTALVKLDYLHSLPRSLAHGEVVLDADALVGLKLECRNLHFSHKLENGESNEIFKGLNLTVEPGQWVSIRGESGSGKSTLLSIMSGLYHTDKGAIYLDEVNMNDIKFTNLGEILGLVRGGSNLIFEGTVKENILLGRPEKVKLRKVLQLVSLDEEIDQLPEGLNTMVKSKGENLSESQIARLLLARALVSHPRLLLIDNRICGILNEEVRNKILDQIANNFDFSPTVVFLGNREELIDDKYITQKYKLIDGKIF